MTARGFRGEGPTAIAVAGRAGEAIAVANPVDGRDGPGPHLRDAAGNTAAGPANGLGRPAGFGE
jgi:hypothetical protein